MSIIPDEELHRQRALNLAPMVDFLFLILAVFAVLAVTRAALFDSELNLVKLAKPSEETSSPPSHEYVLVNLSVNNAGEYKWVTEMHEYFLDGVAAVRHELLRQWDAGLLPKEKEQTKVLLHIDKEAPWDPIAKLIFAVREAGFHIHPVYDAEDPL
jgi:biopolymer transport protein ExbD